MPGEIVLLNFALFVLMAVLSLALVYLGIVHRVQPNFLIPAAVGIILANLPLPLVQAALAPFLGVMQAGLAHGIYPSLIILCRGAAFDLSVLIAHPRQLFLALFNSLAFFGILALGWYWGLSYPLAGGGALIGSGDGVPAIFLTGNLDLSLVGPIGLAAFGLAGLVPWLQPPLLKLITTRQERMIRMAPIRKVARRENVLFAAAGLALTGLLIPGAMPLTGMFFLGNLLRESGVVERLSRTLANRLGDLLMVALGLAVGSNCRAWDILSATFGQILLMGVAALALVTVVAVMAVKVTNLFSAQKINPLVGAAALALIPDAAQVTQILGRREDPLNNLYSHALASSQAALLAATLTAGLFWSILAGN